MGQLGANLGPTWGQLGPAWANLGQLGAHLVQTWPNMGQHEAPWDQLGANMGLPKIEKLAFRFDRNVNFTKWHFSHSPTKFIKKYNLRSLLGRFRKSWKGPGEPFGDTSGGTIGRNHAHPARPSQGRPKGAPGAGPTRPGPARESQNAEPTAPTRPGPARESQKGQSRKRLEEDFNIIPERTKKGRAESA